MCVLILIMCVLILIYMWAHSKHEDGGKDADARALTMHEDTPSSPLAALVLPQPLCQSRSKLSNMPERVLQVFTAPFSLRY